MKILNDNQVIGLAGYYKKLKEFYKKDIKFEFSVENSKIYIIDLKLD